MTESELLDRLVADGLLDRASDPRAASAWANGPGDAYAAHEHGYDKVLVATRGSIDFELPAEGRTARLSAGDRLDLPAGTRHGALVGDEGVRCLEAHLPPGRLDAVRLVAGWAASLVPNASPTAETSGAQGA